MIMLFMIMITVMKDDKNIQESLAPNDGRKTYARDDS